MTISWKIFSLFGQHAGDGISHRFVGTHIHILERPRPGTSLLLGRRTCAIG